jgi:hypothetical protein
MVSSLSWMGEFGCLMDFSNTFIDSYIDFELVLDVAIDPISCPSLYYYAVYLFYPSFFITDFILSI